MTAKITPIALGIPKCQEPACDDFDTPKNDACLEGLHRIDTGSGVIVQIDDEKGRWVTLPDWKDEELDYINTARLASSMGKAASVLRWLELGESNYTEVSNGCYACRGVVDTGCACENCGLTSRAW